MKKFRFRYSVTVWVLLALVLALSTAGLIWNIYNLVAVFNDGGFKPVSYAIVILLTAFLLAFALSITFYGKYVIKNGFLISYFGFVKTKIDLNDVVEITHFKKSDKLVAYFKDNSYTVIVISPELYEQFVLSVREVNKQILYSAKIDGEDTPN